MKFKEHGLSVKGMATWQI